MQRGKAFPSPQPEADPLASARLPGASQTRLNDSEPELHWEPLPSPARQFLSRVLWPLVGLIFVVGFCLSYTSYTKHQLEAQIEAKAETQQQAETQRAAKIAAEKSASELVAFKQEGFGQCTAGDEEGCHYYIDKLRDLGDYKSGEYLKAKMIVAQFLNSDGLLAQDQEDFNKNLMTAKSLKGLALLAAVMGERAPMDAAQYLANTPVPEGMPALPAHETNSQSPKVDVPPLTLVPAPQEPAPVQPQTPPKASPDPFSLVPETPTNPDTKPQEDLDNPATVSQTPADQITNKASGDAPPDQSDFNHN